jgi:hypothetical protein
MPGPHPSHSRDPPGVLSSNKVTRHNPEPGMHSFAVHRLVAWYRQGADVQLLLPKLSTYLGHISLAETQHYLTMTPDLLREAGRRFETYVGVEVQP